MKRLARLGPDECALLTAVRLLDGRIVWREQRGHWCEYIGQAGSWDAESCAAALEEAAAHAAEDGVMGVYPVVARKGTPPQPVSMKEHIRAFGPTVHPEFAYTPLSASQLETT